MTLFIKHSLLHIELATLPALRLTVYCIPLTQAFPKILEACNMGRNLKAQQEFYINQVMESDLTPMNPGQDFGKPHSLPSRKNLTSHRDYISNTV